MENKSVYIMSIQGADIYSHMVRGNEIEFDYCGMIPFSLELMKLKEEGMKVKVVKESGKQISNDVINVKFNQKVISGKDFIKKLNEKIEKLDESEYRNKLQEFVKVIEAEKDMDKWNEVTSNNLRENLYDKGFTITDEKGKSTKYVVHKRSSSKSRTGQCLFIKEKLAKKMIDWSRMYLPFKKDSEIDLASLLAYESLVGSALEDTIEINPNKILIVDDMESKFQQLCNVVEKGKEFLESNTKYTTVKNSLFDGESLLDAKYFVKGQSMKLLRNHMFKSASFSCNIQEFLKDNCPVANYDEWTITNMFGEKMLAKDCELIITPSSLKALKFSNVIGTEQDMWNYWKQLVESEGSKFGVCKHEKKSKRGYDNNGNVLQQTSYQMLNCLPMEKNEMAELATFEKDYYIDQLKNNDEFFIKYISETANDMNGNQMFVDLYKANKDIVDTKVFRDFRKSEISGYVSHIKKGKVRLSGDYVVLLGNPVEFLYHAIGQFKGKPLALENNQVYTSLFPFDKEYVGFRNPNTSPSNVLLVENKFNAAIEKYFNLTDNIVVVNAIDFAIQDILSGCDYDSDTMVLFNSPTLLKLAKKCKKYNVCINNVESQKKKYKLNNADMCEIDNQLSTSQKNIGRVVNLGQLCMSRYWDLLAEGKSEKELEDLLKKIDIMTVLSGICIDLAKKFYEIDIASEINNVNNFLDLKKKTLAGKEINAKPMFWQYVKQKPKNKEEKAKAKDKLTMYNCPMDYLYETMSNLPYAKHHENVDFVSLLKKQKIADGNRHQEKDIFTYMDEMCGKIDKLIINEKDEDEMNTKIDNIIKYYNFYIQKKTIKKETMYSILVHMIEKKYKNSTRLLTILYTNHQETFLNAFKK